LKIFKVVIGIIIGVLLQFKENPTQENTEKLLAEFDELVSKKPIIRH